MIPVVILMFQKGTNAIVDVAKPSDCRAVPSAR